MSVCPLGIALYAFDQRGKYFQQWGQARQVGVMAQEVEALGPKVVCVYPNGYRIVNYTIDGNVHTVH